MTNSTESWEKFLHPDTLKSNLLAISLFITAFENFKESVISKPISFFCNGFDENGYIVDKEYETAVLSLAKNKLSATLLWLKELEAIDHSDIAKFNDIRNHRNEVAHETMAFLADADRDFDVTKFHDLIELFKKIETWWLIYFEASINPDLLPEGTDPNEVVSSSIWSLQLMLDIALGNEPEAGYYLKAFKEKAANP